MSGCSRNPMKDRVAIAGASTTGFVAANLDHNKLPMQTDEDGRIVIDEQNFRAVEFEVEQLPGARVEPAVASGDELVEVGVVLLAFLFEHPLCAPQLLALAGDDHGAAALPHLRAHLLLPADAALRDRKSVV